MKLLTVLAATAVAAAVAAALTIPAGADERGSSPDAEFVDCMRAHGANISADLRGAAIKRWVIAHEAEDGVTRALGECNGAVEKRATPDKLVGCLRDRGLNPPSDLLDLKPWLATQFETEAGRAALRACGMTIGRDKPSARPGGCGDAGEYPEDRPEADAAGKRS
jgi:hypothetical protein